MAAALAVLAAPPVLAPAAQPAPPPPLSAYGELPNISLIRLSPSGARVAFIVRDGGRTELQVWTAAGQTVISRTPLPPAKVRDLLWVDEDRLILTASKTAEAIELLNPKSEYFFGTEINIKTRASRPLLGEGLTGLDSSIETMNTLSRLPTVSRKADGTRRIDVMGAAIVSRRSVLTLFDVTERRARILYLGGPTTTDLAVSPTGQVIGRVDYEPQSGGWTVLVGPDRDHLRKVRTGVDRTGHPNFAGASADGAVVYVNSGVMGEPSISRVDVATGAWRDRPEELSQGALLVDGPTHVALATEITGFDRRGYRFLDPDDDRLWRATVKAFDGAVVSFVSMSADRGSLLVTVDGPSWGYAVYRIDRASHAAAFVTDYYVHIPPEQIARQTVIHYKAADGLDIPAYLTLPVDRPARGLSLIVLPHGGPFARDEPGFDWWSQALASRGYAVLQPQFRGSDGFGLKHLEAGYGEYGGKMQTDLSDGVAWLAQAGTIDPAHVAIMGASYGGYAALAGVTLQSAVYRCAVSVAGPADMRRQMAFLRERANGSDQSIGSRYWREYLKIKDDNDPRLDAISPVRHAAAATAPVLLIHGRDDTVVPIDQSRSMADALRAAGRPVQLVELKGEDHWLSSSETRLQMLESAVGFVQGCNPAR